MKNENITRDRVKHGIHGQNLKTEWKVENIFRKKPIQVTLVYNIHTIFMYVTRNENNNQPQQQKNE